MPKSLTKDKASATETYAKFIAEPFEAGYGQIVGNSLRRALLSSLEGAATGCHSDYWRAAANFTTLSRTFLRT